MNRYIFTLLGTFALIHSTVWGLVPAKTFTLHTVSKSYFAKDSAGNLIPTTINGKNYYTVGNTEVTTATVFTSSKTALVVVDPWADSGSKQLNDHYAPVMKNGVLPLVQKSIALGVRNIIFITNRYQSASYGVAIDPALQQLVSQGKAALLYHEDWTPSTFANALKSQGYKSVIYAGFSSSMCVIARPDTGLIAMQGQGLKLYFVPDASAAIEFDDWVGQPVHKATTQLISQWMAELIDLNEFLSL